MNTYHTFPNCLDIKETVVDAPDYISAKVLQRHRTGLYSTLFGQDKQDSSDTHLYAFMEAALSPAKYALFQYLGRSLIEAVGLTLSPVSSTTSIKVGALGGTILTLIYFALLLRKNNKIIDDATSESFTTCSTTLCKESAYSTLAAGIGALGCGGNDGLLLFMLAGAMGPAVFSIVAFGLLGLVVGGVWGVERVRDWYAGY